MNEGFNNIAALFNIALPTLRNWKSKLRDDKDIIALEKKY